MAEGCPSIYREDVFGPVGLYPVAPRALQILKLDSSIGRLTSPGPEALMFKRIDHVEIVTNQLDRTVQFYTDVLGFRVKARDRIENSGLGVPIGTAR